MNRGTTVFVALALLALLVPVSARASDAGMDRVLFVEATGSGDTSRLVSVADDGSDRRVLAEGRGLANPVWSPDGRHVAFTTWDEEQRADGPTRVARVHVAAADGSDPYVLASRAGRDFTDLTWSPDGQVLAMGLRAIEGGLWLVDVPTGDLRELTRGSDHEPDFSPDSDRLAFVRTVELNEEEQDSFVMVADLHSGGIRQLARGSAPAWSPDGRWIALGGRELISPDGAETRPLPAPCLGAAWAWSPDSRRLACRHRDALYVADLASGTSGTVTTGAEIRAQWSADASTLVFVSYVEGPTGPDGLPQDSRHPLDAVDVDGNNRRRLATDVAGFAVQPGPTVRLAGASRVETAVSVSRRAFRDAQTVVVARADAFPDALAAAPLAGAVGGPVLLTGRDALHPAVAAELGRLRPDTVLLMGDESALSRQVADDVRALGISRVDRVAGPDRFATAAQAARQLASRSGPPDHAYLTLGSHPDPGRAWPDAVAVSALAATQRHPILLTAPDTLPQATLDALRELGVGRVTIVGDTSAVGAAVQQRLENEGIRVGRLAGRTRYETSVAIADASVAAGLDPATTWIATGRNWPDSLTAGPAIARDGGLLLLLDGAAASADSPPVRWLIDHHTDVRQVPVIGSPDAVSPAVAVLLDRAATP